MPQPPQLRSSLAVPAEQSGLGGAPAVPDLRSFMGHRYPMAPRSPLAQTRLTRALRQPRLDRPSTRRSRPICLTTPPCGLGTPLYQSDVKSKAAVGVRTSTSTSVAPRTPRCVRSDTDLCAALCSTTSTRPTTHRMIELCRERAGTACTEIDASVAILIPAARVYATPPQTTASQPIVRGSWLLTARYITRQRKSRLAKAFYQ